MKLIPDDTEIPALYSQDGEGLDAICHIKLFNPCGAATWLLTELSPDRELAFGYCFLGHDVGEPELGYVSIPELEGLVLPLRGLSIERDIHFTPKPLREAIADQPGMEVPA